MFNKKLPLIPDNRVHIHVIFNGASHVIACDLCTVELIGGGVDKRQHTESTSGVPTARPMGFQSGHRIFFSTCAFRVVRVCRVMVYVCICARCVRLKICGLGSTFSVMSPRRSKPQNEKCSMLMKTGPLACTVAFKAQLCSAQEETFFCP